MSWSATAYPPPPRRSSRSRSPSRGGPTAARPPFSDPAYPQDPFRAEWDAYERERAWADYERERAGYDYVRRGRSRSPSFDEAGRKRRRSLSPLDRGRYDPRPRYTEDYDSHSRHGYASPRRGQHPPGGYSSSRRGPPPDPHTFDHPSTLKQYAEWFRYYFPQQAMEEDSLDKTAELEAGDGSKPRNGIRSRWEKYKKEFSANQLQTMFDHHRKSPWFAEKYDPSEEMKALRMRVRKEGWRGRLNTFLPDLEAGKFDSDLTEPEPTADTKAQQKEGATNVTGGDSVPPLSASVEPKVDTAGSEGKIGAGAADDDIQMEGEEEGVDQEILQTEANGKNAYDARRSSGVTGSRGEEISVPTEGNQVMIRTIPPDIGRVRLEEACCTIPGFVHLALGDPLQKRNYYRAGWIRFQDDADMAQVMSELSEKKIEGFKLHVTHNIRPFVNRVRNTPEIASRPDRLAKDLANAKKLASILEEEAALLRKFTPKPLKPTPEENAMDEVESSHDLNNMAPSDKTLEEDPEPPESGSDAVERRAEKIMTDLRDQNLIDISDEKACNVKKMSILLDLYLAYLRAAFHTCYYCCVVTDHLEELQRKCVKHVRKPISKPVLYEVKATEAEKTEKEKHNQDVETDKEKREERDIIVSKERSEHRDWRRNEERWLEWLDSKIALLIDRDGVDPRDYGGKNFDEEISKAVESYIKQEDEGKFRCKTCLKLFKATPFVEKHIANKHPELVKHLEDVPYFNNFALDPHRIQPFAYPPPPVGNSQMPPPQAYGLQGHTYRDMPTGDYGRSGATYYGSAYAQSYPPPYSSNGSYWEPHGYQYAPAPYPPLPPLTRRDEATTARRLSDRISGYAPGYEQSVEATVIPLVAGLPPKPAAVLEPAPPRRGRGASSAGVGAPPPPPDAKEDPRAAAGKKVSYHDMDLVAEGDVELTY